MLSRAHFPGKARMNPSGLVRPMPL